MRLRPAPAHWFETYVPRDETVHALETLAATGMVQLELDPKLAEPLDLQQVRDLIELFQMLRQRYGEFLPRELSAPSGMVQAPERTARKALERLQTWSAPMKRLLEPQTRLENERQDLLLLNECLAALQEASRGIAHLSQRSQFIYKGVFACPPTQRLAANICAAVDEFVPGKEHNFFIVVDQPDCRDIIEDAYRSEVCLPVRVPAWLTHKPDEQKPQVEARIGAVTAQIDAITATLETKKKDPAVAAAMADIDLLIWYLEHTTHLTSVRKLCHVTGWTTAEDIAVLHGAFRRGGIHGAIRFARPPKFSKVPVSMRLPWWASPFQFFLEMLGTPDSTEIDPSKLLPFIVPLLFGYMFPDVGHGLMLIVFSAALYWRWPAGRFLIPCGLSAILFGVVFGEVFGLEHVLDPLWISPLEHPLEILMAPLLLGVGLIMLGLVFNGAEAFWRGETKQWLLRDAAVLVLYAALLGGLFIPEILWIAVFALIWFLVGQLLALSSDRLAHLGKNLGMLLQIVFELALNTLSFLRVGAFALAHAGLSAAILGLTAGISNEILHVLLLALGHVLIVALEGLVAFVQTTRLVLFEFFIRFLHAKGRIFHPMTGPPHA
jgi:V/A-type H+-transporting ATPase subunit I